MDANKRDIPELYHYLLRFLEQERDEAGRGEKGRRLSVAITELETSQMWFKSSLEPENRDLLRR